MRVGVVLLLAALLSGCVTTAENTLNPQRRAALRVDSVRVTFAPSAVVNWADAESEYDRSRTTTGGSAAYVRADQPTGERRAFVEQRAAAKISEAFQQKVVPAFRGTEPARVEVVVKSLDLPSGLRRVLIGGNHNVTAEITLVDARTGATILRAPDFQGQAGAGQGAMVLVDQMLPNPIDRAANTLANNYKSWLASGSQIQGLL